MPAISAGGAVDEPLPFDLDLHARIEPAEGLGPERHHVVHRVRADAVEAARDAADALIRRQRGIDLCACAPRRTPPATTAATSANVRFMFLWPRDELENELKLGPEFPGLVDVAGGSGCISTRPMSLCHFSP